MKWKIACIQFDVAFGNPEANIEKICNLIKEAGKDKPDIIVLPELWTTGYDLTRLDKIADAGAFVTTKLLKSCAKEQKSHIVGGSVAKKTNKGIYNTMLTVNKAGEVAGEYSKLHLFRLMDEHLFLQPGKTDGLFELDDITCAGFICYDLRFPEWIRAHTTKNAKAIFIVAEWPLARVDHWRTLLIARAIENQCYVIACNRSGADPKNTFAGHSMIISPWGEILAEAGEEEATITATIDLDKVDEVRKQIPIFEDRRPQYY
ncbi:carbon-nitrogen family hydrolase [Sutcliffiella deserti]|uniref:carbon-nitrogen family hydrolase n=1 Tax=Sutcliffiella deserti TaxID=2875501 RepID=UPI001CC1126D|nr:carbon-nitrogen family hydrolase [Sutcliffiella deserti]